MTIHYVPTDTIGHYIAPEGCTEISALNCHMMTSLAAPESCKHLRFESCSLLTEIIAPMGCAYLSVDKCPFIELIAVSEECHVWVDWVGVSPDHQLRKG